MLLPFMYFTVSASDTEPLRNDTVELVREDCYYQNGNLMLPFRTFWETFGAAVDWDDEQNIASVYYESNTEKFEINVFMGEKPQPGDVWHIQEIDSGITVKLNGYVIPQISYIPACADMTVNVNGMVFPVFFDAAAEIKDGRLYIPADVLTDTFGAVLNYKWDMISVKFSMENILETAQRETERAEIIRLINNARAENGVSPLKQIVVLDKVCNIKAKDRAEYKYHGHVSQNLGAPAEMLANFAPEYTFTGECLYYCSGKVPYDRVFEAWMNSPGHRDSILYEYALYIGINTAIDDSGGVHWALITSR